MSKDARFIARASHNLVFNLEGHIYPLRGKLAENEARRDYMSCGR